MRVDNNTCYLCNSEDFKCIQHGVRGNDNINVLECNSCGLVRLNTFKHISDEFYEKSKMNNSFHTFLEVRKLTRDDDERRFLFLQKMIENKDVLDFGCGSGGFLARARNIAKEISGIELDEVMVEGLKQEGIKCEKSIRLYEKKVDIITMFHVLEHLSDPCSLLNELKNKLLDDGFIFIEVPNADDALLKLYKSKSFANFTYWQCHLFLYNNHTLKLLADKCGMKVRFVKQIQRYPLANHLYWLANDKPGGHYKWSFLENDMMDKQYGDMLANLGMADTVIAVFEK